MNALSRVRRIGIFRALQLGDLLCSIPAFRALRRAFPDTHIELVSLPGACELAGRYTQYLDECIVFPGYPGLPEQHPDAAAFERLVTRSRQAPYDLLLQMQGNGTLVNEMLSRFGAHRLVGYCPTAAGQNRNFLHYPETPHEVDRHLLLMEHLGIPAAGAALEFPVTDTDRRQLARLFVKPDGKNYICIHPGSRGSWRQWPLNHFAAMADLFANRGFTVVLTGTPAEHHLCHELAELMMTEPVNLCGQTDLGMLAALLESAGGILCNCTGISHLAAALRVPSVVISMDGEPHRWGPKNRNLHETIDWRTTPDAGLVRQAAERLLRRVQVPQ